MVTRRVSEGNVESPLPRSRVLKFRLSSITILSHARSIVTRSVSFEVALVSVFLVNCQKPSPNGAVLCQPGVERR